MRSLIFLLHGCAPARSHRGNISCKVLSPVGSVVCDMAGVLPLNHGSAREYRSELVGLVSDRVVNLLAPSQPPDLCLHLRNKEGCIWKLFKRGQGNILLWKPKLSVTFRSDNEGKSVLKRNTKLCILNPLTGQSTLALTQSIFSMWPVWDSNQQPWC